VTGIDLDRIRVDSTNSGVSYILEVPNETLCSLVSKGNLRATQSFAAIENLDTLIICVPTPLKNTDEPELSYVVAAIEAVNNHLKIGHLIIVESTIYPGMTRKIVLPILQKSGLEVGKHFFLAFSPQRVEGGTGTDTGRNIPKIIGGMTDRCAELSTLFYRQFIEKIVPVYCSKST
jgi:UDP-N-acetyl-D-glucosamine dehydrogenase